MNNMNYITHNDSTEIDINGTHGQGQANCSYATLVKAFGLPLDGDGYKVDAEWWAVFEDGTRATIYNWKNGKNYCGADGLDLDQIGIWNIGGNNYDAVTRVLEVIKSIHNEGATV